MSSIDDGMGFGPYDWILLLDKIETNQQFICLSNEEYSVKDKKNCNSERLSFSQLISTTKKLWADHQHDLNALFNSIISSDNDWFYENTFAELLKGCSGDATNLHASVDQLKTIYERKVKRYETKKAEGLWGKIQWLFFTLFIDKSHTLEKLKNLILTPEDNFFLMQEILKQQATGTIRKFTQDPEKINELSNLTSNKLKDVWTGRFAQPTFFISSDILKSNEIKKELTKTLDFWCAVENVRATWEQENSI